MSITKIVVTGGPCGGKTSAKKRIKEVFEKNGYRVLFVPETATELIEGGVSPTTCGTNADFQKCLLGLQIAKENAFETAASTMDCEKILIVCDRGVLDNKAYMTDKEFDSVLRELGVSEVELRDEYDAVFHLVTAANGAEKHYGNENNGARTETPEMAREIDEKLIAAWTGHPHFRVIDNSTDFDGKMSRLLGEISVFLGVPKPMEIERKYLIEYPDIQWLENNPNCKRVQIIQTYLNAPDGEEVRVRQRGVDGNYVFFRTAKRKLSDVSREEIEERITKDEYLTLLMDADTTKRQIRKDRYCLTYAGQYFEIDVYPFWNDRAIMEIELRSEDTPINLPQEIRVIKEVTDDESYKNSSLAKMIAG